MRALHLVVVVIACVAACKRAQPEVTRTREPTRPAPAAASSPSSPELLDDIALLATGRPFPPEQRAATLDALRTGTKTFDQVIDEVTQHPEFANDVVPRIWLGESDGGPGAYVAALNILNEAKVDGQSVFSYRHKDKPCALADSTPVAPWWDPTHPINVCNDDYKPDGFRTKAGYFCSGTMVENDPECGCGPHLVNCVRDRGQRLQVSISLRKERDATISYLVAHDRPLREALTTTATFRDRNAEAMRYREALYVASQQGRSLPPLPPRLNSWSTDGVWAERPELWPGSRGGILSIPSSLYISDGPRDRMQLFLARAWCTSPGSFGVTTAQFKELLTKHASVRALGEGWQTLAATPGCTDCHARMDYAMQFLSAYPAVSMAVTPVLETSQHTTRGPIYLRNIDDPRGEALRTPAALGKLIVDQPEFSDCVVTRIKEHVLGTHVQPDDQAYLDKTFAAADGRVRPVFVAALKLLVARETAAAAVAAPAHGALAGKPLTARVSIPPRLATLLHTDCGDCHEDGDHNLFGNVATSHTLPVDVLLTAADLVADDEMPKDGELRREDKAALLEAIVEAAAPDEAWAANARAYWLDQFSGSHTYDFATVKDRIAEMNGTSIGYTAGVEEMLEGRLLTLTPSYVSRMGELALTTCKSLKAQPDKYRECLSKATSPTTVLAP